MFLPALTPCPPEPWTRGKEAQSSLGSSEWPSSYLGSGA